MKNKIPLCIFFFPLFSVFNIHAQVSNDNAEKAQAITINAAPHKSDTRNCTLEEKCIDRKLTAKCLVYHNDQWFTFTTGTDSVYYLSVQKQDCRDVNGIQLQVMEGKLCKPSTYQVLHCISLATQDDIYITLRNLRKNHTYIVNVDGYLHDFCQFEIGISTALPDFAVQSLPSIQDLNGIQKNGNVWIEWKLNEELENLRTESFEIRRRFEQEKKFTKNVSIPVERTVHGAFQKDYHHRDTVGRKGYYYYQVVAVTANGTKFLAGEYAVLFQPVMQNRYELPIELPCKDKTPLTIYIYNWETNFLLDKRSTSYLSNGKFSLNLESYFQPGVLRLKLVIYDHRQQKIKEILADRKY